MGLKINSIGIVWVTAVVCAMVVCVAAGSDDVIADQAGTTRTILENGLEVVVVADTHDKRRAQGGEVQVWLIVRAGSLNERDSQRGSAMVVERAIRLGTKRTSSEQIDVLLRDVSIGYSAHKGSFVSFDQTAFMVDFDRLDLSGMEEAFSFFGEVLGEGTLVLNNARIKEAIGLVVEEIEGEDYPEMRARQSWLPRLMRGTPFGERLPRPKIEELRRLSGNAVRVYRAETYHPARAMVLVVGDVQSDVVVRGVVHAMGSIPRGERDRIVDGRSKIDVSKHAVLMSDPELVNGQAAMIWCRDQGEGSTKQWSERAELFTTRDMRQIVVERVAGEIVRHRIGRLSSQELGIGVESGLDQIDLWGQINLVQIGVEKEGLDWESSMRFLVGECDRLHRDGATQDEVARARRSVLARWHRQADDWVGQSNARRMGLVHWLVTTGRPVIDMVRWDQLSTELMGGVRDEEIIEAVRALIDPERASFVGLVSELDDEAARDHTQWCEGLVIRVVEEALANPLGEIDPDWMVGLSGSLLDAERSGGEIQEVSVHEESGVWDAKLKNGIRVWARTMSFADEDEQRVSLTATVWGSVFDRAKMGNDEVESALIAWRTPSTEIRRHRTIAAYIEEHDLTISVRREAGLVQLSVDGPSGSIDQSMELLFALLDRPMIERSAFERWQNDQVEIEVDPIDRGLEALYRVDTSGCESAEAMTLDSAQRILTQIVRNGRIDIGIAGAIDTERAIEDANTLFGSLVKREVQLPIKRAQKSTSTRDVIRGALSMSVETDDPNERGVVLGFVGEKDQQLVELRSLILSSMVLTDRLGSLGELSGFDGELKASVAYADAIPDQMVLLVRARCDRDSIEEARSIIHEAISSISIEGISKDELVEKQIRINESISWYFDTAGYWSQRLGMLGVRARRIDDLWKIREGYQAIEPELTMKVFEALVAGDEQFEIVIDGD